MSNAEIHKLLEALAQTPNEIALAIATLSDTALRRKNAADEFSVVENICHLRDLEVEGYGVRIRAMLSEEQPSLPNFDGGRIALERNYNNQDIRSALELFAEARKCNLDCLRDLKPEEFARTGTLEGVGRITLRDLILMMREHDEGHLQTLICRTQAGTVA